MRLLLLRHGSAENRNLKGDEYRSLTRAGQDECELTARFLRGKFLPGLIISSPLLRARQTSEIFARELGYKGEIVSSAHLTPGASLFKTIGEIGSLSAREILLTGHNPHISLLAAKLTSEGSLNVLVETSTVICIDFPGLPVFGEGYLNWVVKPGLLANSDGQRN